MSDTTTTQGQIALVTGASRGIGRAIAMALAAQGMKVIGTATTDAGAAAIGEALAPQGGSGLKLDVTDAAALDAAIDAIVKQHGGLHVLVNNAGITRDTLAMRMKDEDWDAVLDTNLKAVFRASRAAIRPMMKQRYGRIVNITSVVGASGNGGQANYAAAKAGVAGMTRSLARELGARNITVNCIAPGLTRTPQVAASLPEAFFRDIAAAQSIPRNGTPADQAPSRQYEIVRRMGEPHQRHRPARCREAFPLSRQPHLQRNRRPALQLPSAGL